MQSKIAPSLDDVCILQRLETVVDSIGNEIRKVTAEREVWCAETPASQYEFFRAAQQGITPECVLVLDSTEYGGESAAVSNGIRYAIYRVYPRPDGMTELYLQRKAGD